MSEKTDNHSHANALRLHALVEMASDGIITMSQRGIIESVNRAACQLFEFEKEEMLGQNIKMLMPEPDHSQHDGYLERYNRTHDPHIIGIGREVWGKKKGGLTFPLRLAVSEVKLADRVVYTGMLHDISKEHAAKAEVKRLNQELEQKVVERTEELGRTLERMLTTNETLAAEMEQRREIEKKLREREADLQESLEKERELNELKSRFLSMASHEFKTPLSTVLSSTELIELYEKQEDQNKREKHINRIKSAVQQLTDVLNDFLSLSQIEQGEVACQLRWVDLAALISSSIESSEGQLKNGQVIELELAQNSQQIYTDPKLLQHVLINLISNAAKYSESGKTIIIRAKTNEEFITIDIIDQGIGIPENDQKHIYDRFFRAQNVENINGTGLGLNIVQQYAQLIKGQLSFISKVGHGSVFTIKVPLNPQKK